MHAIARVNRVWGDKPGGLIVDLLGLADQRADALATYSRAGGTGQAVRRVQDEAVTAMQSAFETLRVFFHGLDYGQALDAALRDVLPVYLGAIDHVLGADNGWTRFRTLVKAPATAFALAVPRPETDLIARHLAFFQRAAAMIRKRRRMPKLDWTQRESVRATLRRNVRRLLAKYGYPPDLAEGATQLMLRQAELSTEDFVE